MAISQSLQNSTYITLSNGLRVLICPHQSPQTHLSLSVRAGHFYDPVDCQGLAHLLEHVMFMGSLHFPKPNEIKDFIESHSGSLNAWTGAEYSNFHYSCLSDSLAMTLPAFADMIRQPLLYESAIQTEIQSIDAEFQFKLRDDLRRLYQIHKETCNPNHPFAKFSVGNKAIFEQHSLSSLREKLRTFHQQYFTGANMALCIASSLCEQDVCALVESAFSGVKSGIEANTQWPSLYTSKELAVEIAIKPLQKARRMIVTFALPGLHHDLDTKPLNFISHLIGDEGKGSLLAWLKHKGWASNLIAGSGIEGDSFKDFNVNFQLTDSGMQNREHILCALFAFIQLIKRGVHEAWRFEEKRTLTALATQFDDAPASLSMICDLAQSLFIHSHEKLRDVFCANETYNPSVLDHALRYFVPENIRVKVISNEVETDKCCQFYGAEYRMNALPQSLLLSLSQEMYIDELSLPPANPFVAKHCQKVKVEPEYLQLTKLLSKPAKHFWFAQDDQFNQPKGDVYISIDSEGFCQNLDNVIRKRIWLSALNDYLQEKYYRAEIAGLHYRIYGHQAGLTLHTSGFSEQQLKLATQLFQTMQTFSISESTFNHHLLLQKQGLQNTLLNKPTNRLFSRLSVLIQRNTQAPIELIGRVDDITFDSMAGFMENAFSDYYIESLVHGNWSFSEAQAFAKQADTLSSQATGKAISRRVSRLTPGKLFFHEVACDHNDAAAVLYLQAPSDNIESTAMCMVIEQLLSGPFFNSLRTDKQLGYIVGTGFVPQNQHPGMAFYIQSPSHSSQILLDAMIDFLFQQLNEIDFYKNYWEVIQANLTKQLQSDDASLSMKSQRLWVELGNDSLKSQRNKKLAAFIRSLSFEDIQVYASKIAERRVYGELALFARGRFAPIEPPQDSTIKSIAEFKNNVAYFQE